MLWRLLEQSATVVIHGDEHLGNLYVTADGTPGVIDWFARPDHWPVGIAYFMVCALDVIDRRNWERPVVVALRHSARSPWREGRPVARGRVVFLPLRDVLSDDDLAEQQRGLATGGHQYGQRRARRHGGHRPRRLPVARLCRMRVLAGQRPSLTGSGPASR